MTPDEARDLIFGVFRDAWNPAYPVVWDDVPGTVPATDTPWARLRLQHELGFKSTITGEIGCRRFDTSGTLFVQVFSPIGQGMSNIYALARAVQEAYQDARLAVWFRNVRIREAGSNGGFQQLNVITDFEYETVR